MGKILVIAEKPSVGRDIAKVLKCTEKGDGYLYSNKYIVSWAIGHLVALSEPHEYDIKYKNWKFDELPIIPTKIKLKAIAKTKSQFNILRKLMNEKETDSIICATDSGREGELIFRYIYSLVKCKKSFKRLWISSMTNEAITEGFNRLKDGQEYDNLYMSAKCRSESDWLVGINASRAFTIKNNVLLSIGRVQTPTLAILVNRQKEIDAFVPKDYWEVTASFKFTKFTESSEEHLGKISEKELEIYNGKWFDLNKKENETRIDNADKSDSIAKKVRGQAGEIISLEKEQKKQPPPLLYDLTELQRDCNNRFGYSASKTLDIAQGLYEKRKMITYPRTDSRYLSSDMQPKIKGALKKLLSIDDYKPYAETILNLPKLPISKRIIDDTKINDHHAIIPTDGSLSLQKLSVEEFNVFNLIAIRFFSVFYPYYEYFTTKIVTKVAEEHFITKGSTVLKLGWMIFYKNDKQNNTDNVALPNTKKGDKVIATNAISEKKQTKPPKPYTEATLLSAMENAGRLIDDEELKEQMKESGLGTPATRASIFERLLTVGYVEKIGKTLIPTEKGIKLIEILPNELKSPETTGKWEKGLSSISKGKMSANSFMESITRYVNYIVAEAEKSQNTTVFPEDKKRNKWKKGSSKKSRKNFHSFGKCPTCGVGNFVENTKAYYCDKWREGCKTTIWKNTLDRYGYSLTGEILTKLLDSKKIENLSVVSPQNHEKCTADLIINLDSPSIIEFINFR